MFDKPHLTLPLRGVLPLRPIGAEMAGERWGLHKTSIRCCLGAMLMTCLAAPALAYTAAGDRLFPATILLPQTAPSDDAYFIGATQPLHSTTAPSGDDRLSTLSAVYNKTITENLGIGIEGSYDRFDHAAGGTASGWENIDTTLKYLAVINQPHELLLSVGFDREWGGTGARGIGASTRGATTPGFYLAKGMGDLDWDWLKPVAVLATGGYSFADQAPRPNQVVGGLAVEYSIPYLVSKVRSVDLPDFVRAMTPIVEMSFATPNGNSRGARTTMTFAPGINYAGEGWEFGIEALVPATRASGTGLGVTAQLHLALDYLLPDSVGRPIFGMR